MSSRKAKKTVKTLFSLTPELLRALEKKARETFGDRQGAVSMYAEMVFRNHLGLAQPNVEEV